MQQSIKCSQCSISDMVCENSIYKQYLRVSFKISIVDGLNQLLRDFNDLLLSCWFRETGGSTRTQSSFIHMHYLKIANQLYAPSCCRNLIQPRIVLVVNGQLSFNIYPSILILAQAEVLNDLYSIFIKCL